jgi:hypothetical protein
MLSLIESIIDFYKRQNIFESIYEDHLSKSLFVFKCLFLFTIGTFFYFLIISLKNTSYKK